ncbi:MAG: oligoendopeptidase F [Pseudomonadota bacterium]|nr:oligoendopeptidase F [Pseudomonadota bacterium]
MSQTSSPEAPVPSTLKNRVDIDDRHKWDLTRIYPDWTAWKAGYDELSRQVDAYAALRGTLASGPAALLAAYRLGDELGQLSYKVWYYAALMHDEDQRDNEVGARRQQVQILFARSAQASAWFSPELLAIPLATVRAWMAVSLELALYRFAIEDLYRQQEHVLDEKGEHLLSLAGRLTGAPGEAYAALSTADMKFPTLRLSNGQDVTLSYGTYRKLLATNREQADRAAAFRLFHGLYLDDLNTYASLYDGVLQRDWFLAQARGFTSTLEAALHGDNIPPSVVENLIATTRAGVAPLQRYHQLRKRALGLDRYFSYDGALPLVPDDRRYSYDDVLDWLIASVAPLGADYQAELEAAVRGRFIDVYENPGKRSGAYSASVYGVHPYVLMNYNDTLDAVFTLAHEMGHSMHTLLAHRHQPFAYAGYTIFVAEVPSTLNEALFLEFMLGRTQDPAERVVLLTHAIDEIVGTFYSQVMFADFELAAHRLVEQGQPITADGLSALYMDTVRAYHGDAVEYEPQAASTWARIHHFFASPYYVYQYATCYASTAQLVGQVTAGAPEARAIARERYLDLLRAGGSDYPMALLKRAGVDLARPEAVKAVEGQLDALVSRLEAELGALGVI